VHGGEPDASFGIEIVKPHVFENVQVMEAQLGGAELSYLFVKVESERLSA
jgi:hypothetical protein